MEENIKNWSVEFDKTFKEKNKIYLQDEFHLKNGVHLINILEPVKQFITELLQREKEEVEIRFGAKALKDILWANETGFKNGYNYARKEMKQWAEEKVGENHDKLLEKLLKELN